MAINEYKNIITGQPVANTPEFLLECETVNQECVNKYKTYSCNTYTDDIPLSAVLMLFPEKRSKDRF